MELAAKNNKQTPPRGQEACGPFHQNRRPTLFPFAFLWENSNIGVQASVKLVISPPSLA